MPGSRRSDRIRLCVLAHHYRLNNLANHLRHGQTHVLHLHTPHLRDRLCAFRVPVAAAFTVYYSTGIGHAIYQTMWLIIGYVVVFSAIARARHDQHAS